MIEIVTVKSKSIEEIFLLPKISDAILQYGKNGIILSGCGKAVSQHTIDRIAQQLDQCSTILKFSQINSGCQLTQARQICNTVFAKVPKIDWILTIGGGSVIDMGKLVREILSPQSSLGCNILHFTQSLNKKIYLISLPTSIGSAAEISSVISYLDLENKYSIRNKAFTPDNVILVPSVYKTLSILHIEAGIFDAISHSLDPIISNHTYIDIDIKYSISIIKYLLNNLQYLNNIQEMPEHILLSIVNATHLLALEGNGRPSTISLLHRIEHCLSPYTKLPHGAILFHLFKAFIRNSTANNQNLNQIIKEFCPTWFIEDYAKQYFIDNFERHFPALSQSQLWLNAPNITKISNDVIKLFGQNDSIETIPPVSSTDVTNILTATIATAIEKTSPIHRKRINKKKIFGGTPYLHSLVVVTPVEGIFNAILSRYKANVQDVYSGWFKTANIHYTTLKFTLICAGPYSSPLIDCLHFLSELEGNIQQVIFCGFCGVAGDSKQIGTIVNPSSYYSYSKDMSTISFTDIKNKEMNSSCVSFETLHQEWLALSLNKKSIKKGTYIDLELFHIAKWATQKNIQLIAYLGVTDDIFQNPLWSSDTPFPVLLVEKLINELFKKFQKELGND